MSIVHALFQSGYDEDPELLFVFSSRDKAQEFIDDQCKFGEIQEKYNELIHEYVANNPRPKKIKNKAKKPPLWENYKNRPDPTEFVRDMQAYELDKSQHTNVENKELSKWKLDFEKFKTETIFNISVGKFTVAEIEDDSKDVKTFEDFWIQEVSLV